MVSLRKGRSSKGPDLIPAEVILDGGNEHGVHRQSINVLDSHEGGRAVGSLMLPVSKAIGGFCVGGGHIYIMGKGASPELWRVPVPNMLRQPAQFVREGVTHAQ